MAAPIVYRWDDANAPIARGERRSLCDILYACLVTGYGTKLGAGWTREYVNATFDKAAFRNNPVTGTGFFLQVDGLTAANAYTPKLQGFEAMTSESDGLFPFNAATSNLFTTSNAASTSARPWILIADDRAFWLIIWTTITTTPTVANTYSPGIFFGDFVSRFSDDAYACGLLCYYGAFPLLLTPATVGGSNSDLKVPRKYSGAVGSSYLAATVHGGGPGTYPYMGSNGAPYTPGDLIYSRPHINDGSAYSFRGFFPGLYYPCHQHPFAQFEAINAAGKNFIGLKCFVADSNIGTVMISLDDWRV